MLHGYYNYRHLILTREERRGEILYYVGVPGNLRYLHDTYGNDIYVSIMNQYTPLENTAQVPGLNRRVTEDEYKRVLDFAEKIGIENGFLRQGETGGGHVWV